MDISNDILTLSFPIKIGSTTIEKGDLEKEELLAEIEKYNEKKSLADLAKTCNPALRDPDKVIALLQWVNNHEKEIKEVLSDAPLYLSNPALPISFGDPITIESITAGRFIKINSDEKNYKSLIHVTANLDQAIELYKQAKISFDKFHEVVNTKEISLETEEDQKIVSATMDELMFDRHKRFRSLLTMELNARVLLELSNDFEEDELLEIEDLLDELEVPPLNDF